jgi:transketolase
MPSLELFHAQPEADQLALIPDDGTPVVAIEAGRGESYRGLVGRRGLIIGMSHFGESAPAGKLAEEFGFTPGAVAERVAAHLAGA